MKRTSFIIAASAGILFAVSCKKDIPDTENTYPGLNVSNGALDNFFAQHAPTIQQFTMNAASGGYFTASGGATVYFPAGALAYQNGQPVTGNVTISIQEVYNRRDMILAGAYTTSNGLPLVSGGEINVTAYQGTLKLKLMTSNSVMVTMPAGTSTPATMYEFRAPMFNEDRDFIPVNPNQAMQTTLDSAGSWVYSFALDSLDWTNCDQYMSMAGPTEFNIPVPNIFNGENCMVFVTSGMSNYASRIWHWSEEEHRFECGYYRLPVGQTFTFTAIAEINGNFYYDSRTVEITENISVTLNPVLTSEAQVLQNIGNL